MQGPVGVQPALDAHAAVEGQIGAARRPAAAGIDGGAQAVRAEAACNRCLLHQRFDDHAFDLAGKAEGRVGGGARQGDGGTGPRALDQRARRERRWTDGDAGHGRLVSADVGAADRADLVQLGHALDARGHDGARSIAQPADLDELPHRQALGRRSGDPRLGRQGHGAAHHFNDAAVAEDAGDRAFVGVDDGDRARDQPLRAVGGSDGDDLAHRQVVQATSLAVLADRGAAFVVDFKPIDADRGKAGDRADDTDAAGLRRAGSTDATIRERAAGAADPALGTGRRFRAHAGAADARVLCRLAGAADAAVLRRRAPQLGVDADRRGVRGQRQESQECGRNHATDDHGVSSSSARVRSSPSNQ